MRTGDFDLTTIEPKSDSQHQASTLTRVARIRGLRALAWCDDVLYASRGYELLRAQVNDAERGPNWETVAKFQPPLKRRISVQNRLSARLFRDGFHALSVLPDGALIAAVPGAIITCDCNESEFHVTHAITRGTRPLHITAVPSGAVYWGEYFDNPQRDAVHIYGSSDGGESWHVAYAFPKSSIRHVHNIVYDRWANCLWVLTGDYGDECRILRSSCDFTQVEVVLQGKQQARAVAAIPTEDAIYFASDTPLESNYIYRLDRRGTLTQLAGISSSSIYGCRVGTHLFFSTMVEPSQVNRDRNVRIYAADERNPDRWQSVLSWPKDAWHMALFQYGNAFFPDGDNTTPYLAVSTGAVKSEDAVTSIYRVP
jgi:hypothetical protein